ncbi:carbohydrate binding domain-containing protein [Chitinispirillales bacterium ANBcel5]|uniref:carbohydrate binding domain-containing protein n=1 Tax=Cellulosispirillum alkaliphilum TaxID=3039283 RepID=UPI002A528B0F|nr:carbohydrate binding domain-containing protein [Chitinispirillales bacterium ANBcel5]
MVKKTILFTAVFCLNLYALAVFHVGNSQTDAAYGIVDIAIDRGYDHFFGRHMIPGAPLEWLWDNICNGHREPRSLGDCADEILRARSWDVVVMQHRQRSVESDVNSAIGYMTAAFVGNPDCQAYYFQEYVQPRDANDPEDVVSYWLQNNPSINHRTRLSTHMRADSLTSVLVGMGRKPARIVPIGEVFFEINRRISSGQTFPEVTVNYDLFSSDSVHLNSKGMYINAVTHFATIYGEDPHNSPISGLRHWQGAYGVSQEFAEAVWEVVWTVVSNHDYTGFSGYRLQVNSDGPGAVTISPEKSVFEQGETVTLTASPQGNAEFIGWGGDGSGVENPLVVTMNSNKIITATFFDPDAPMVKNGDFSQEDQYWTFITFDDGDGTFSTLHNRADVTITDGGSLQWHVQLYQENITLNENTYYKFSFDAMAQSSRDIAVSLKHNDLPWTPYLEEVVSLTTEMKTYDFVFKMVEPNDSNSRAEFNFGTSDGNISIDNVSLTVVEHTTSVAHQLLSNSTGIKVKRHGPVLKLNTASEGTRSVQLYDARGRVIRSWNINGPGTHYLSVGALAGGIYILKMTEGKTNFVRRLKFQ